jgi:tyrosine-protein kinase Etk/Wzc
MSEYQNETDLEPAATRSNELSQAVRNAVAAVRRRWWLALGVFVAVVGIAMWRTTRQPRLYQAMAVVQLDRTGRPAMVQEQPTPDDWRVDPIQSAQEIIKSQAIAERVAHRLGLRLEIARPAGLRRTELFGDSFPVVDTALGWREYTVRLSDDRYALVQDGRAVASARYGSPVAAPGVRFTVPARPEASGSEVVLVVAPGSRAAAQVRGGIGTRGRPQTNIIEITYTGTEPFYVKHIADGVAAAYRAFDAEERQRQAIRRTQTIEAALVDQQRQLDLAQAALRDFKEAQQLSNVSAEQEALVESIQSFETKRDELLIERDVYQKILGRLGAADTSSAELRRLAGTPAVENNDYIGNLYDRWFELVKAREELHARGLRSPHRDVVASDSLIAGTKADLREASALYLQNLQSRIASLESRVAGLRGEMGRYPRLEAEESRLAADVRMAANVYEALQADLQRARISQAIDQTNVRIVDQASVPGVPIAPQRRRIFLTALIFGALLGLGAAVAVEQLDDSVKLPDEVRERFDLAVLGTIPEIREGSSSRQGHAPVGDRLVTHLDPRSPVAEAYRSLRTNLAFARAQQALRTIVLTSPGPADGKSTTVANLAITFAQQGQRTLLVDADLRRAVLDRLFDVPRTPGLTDVLVGQATLADVVHATAIPNLSVIGSGHFPPNPSELLGSAAMRDSLREAQEMFDIVLLDSPPLLAVTDAAVLSTMVDGAVLVVRMGRTQRTSVRRAIGQLRAVHGHLVGAVLNDVDFRQGGYGGYGYYYYYYYGQDGRGNGAGGVLGRVRQWTRLGAGSSHRSS